VTGPRPAPARFLSVVSPWDRSVFREAGAKKEAKARVEALKALAKGAL